MAILVQVDDRESAAPIPGLLRQSPEFHVVIKRLSLGDYLVDNRYLFERKTMPDLAAAIISGRLFAQAAKLAGTPLRPAILLEGTSKDLSESGMSWESIQGALVTVSLFYGIPLLRTRTPEETVRTMLFASQQGRAYAIGALPRPGYRPRGKRARQLFILQGFPGIGPERARRLLARFGSVQAVVNARPEALRAIKGVGTQVADRIRWSLEEPHPAYSQDSALWPRSDLSTQPSSNVATILNAES